jgi:hypothetical protein
MMQPTSITSEAEVESLLHLSNTNLSSIKSINISFLNMSMIVRVLSACPSLMTLGLIQCNLTDDNLRELANLCPKVTALTMFKLDQISDNGFRYLADWKSLRRVKLFNLPQVTEKGLSNLLEQTNSINKISLFLGRPLDGCAIRSLLRNHRLPPQITIVGNDVTDELAETIVQSNPHIERLAVRCSGLSMNFIQRLVDYAKKNNVHLKLSKLKVTRTKIRQTDLPVLEKLLPGVEIVIK